MTFLFGVAPLASCMGVVALATTWVQNKVNDVWEDEVWDAQRQASKKPPDVELPEPTQWFNKLIGSIWPLVNPDLFNSVSDTLEDVMQASLPRFVRMISVDDIGQGSVPLRILGVKWLPKGAADRSVSNEGKIESSNEKRKRENERDDDDKKSPAEGQSNQGQQDEDEQTDEVEGLEAEEGDFVNLELGFAYRANKSRGARARNAHLLLDFYLPGNIKLPVWVELRGIIGSVRLRMQVVPDPPFVALCTLTFLGQPKVNLSCIPLLKQAPNIMDLPLISNFVQSAIDAAVSEYVAPKSLTLDLKSMLAGDDFKKDTWSRGIVAVRIKRAFDFKEGDANIPGIKDGQSDAYISAGWAKFGKALWSTRVIINDMEPYWMEEAFLLVGPEELDADESLRLQLWDSDRFTADDDLGRVELDLKGLMRNEKSNGKMWDRTDAFEALAAGEGMPGRVEWSVGYFSKTRLQDWQVEKQKKQENIKTVKQLKQHVYETAEKKLRETTKDETAEVEEQKRKDLEETEIEMISATAPDEEWPCGILSVQIHQIVGLELANLSKSREDDGGDLEDTEEDSENLPSSYCTVILNHAKVFKTRTKPKNRQPFFNASTEKFVRDWRTLSLLVGVRDARLHENDALVGVVALPLGDMFRKRGTSRFSDFFPLAGGIGFGRIRISVVFRSVAVQPPPESLGWDYGTLIISSGIKASDDLPSSLHHCRLRLSNKIDKGKMHSSGQGIWAHGHRRERPIRIAVRKRYSNRLLIEFRPSSTGILVKSSSSAFAVLWLAQIRDKDEQELTLPVFQVSKGSENLKRAAANTLPEDQMGEKIGTITLTICFERGLSERHHVLAKRIADIGNVQEVLHVVRDNELGAACLNGENEGHTIGEKEIDEEDQDDDSSSDDSDDDNDEEKEDGSHQTRPGTDHTDTNTTTTDDDTSNLSPPSSSSKDQNESKLTSMKSDVKEYLKHKDQLHRTHRGAMQWKAPRTAKWLKTKAEHLVEKVEGQFEHKEREPGVETEV